MCAVPTSEACTLPTNKHNSCTRIAQSHGVQRANRSSPVDRRNRPMFNSVSKHADPRFIFTTHAVRISPALQPSITFTNSNTKHRQQGWCSVAECIGQVVRRTTYDDDRSVVGQSSVATTAATTITTTTNVRSSFVRRFVRSFVVRSPTNERTNGWQTAALVTVTHSLTHCRSLTVTHRHSLTHSLTHSLPLTASEGTYLA